MFLEYLNLIESKKISILYFFIFICWGFFHEYHMPIMIYRERWCDIALFGCLDLFISWWLMENSRIKNTMKTLGLIRCKIYNRINRSTLCTISARWVGSSLWLGRSTGCIGHAHTRERWWNIRSQCSVKYKFSCKTRRLKICTIRDFFPISFLIISWIIWTWRAKKFSRSTITCASRNWSRFTSWLNQSSHISIELWSKTLIVCFSFFRSLTLNRRQTWPPILGSTSSRTSNKIYCNLSIGTLSCFRRHIMRL